jgi:two-component system sensor histidine kinase/response regulator
MPQMDGFQVFERIRQDQLAESPVIMLTAAGLRGDVARCRELNVPGHLPKPTKRKDLLYAIKTALGVQGGDLVPVDPGLANLDHSGDSSQEPRRRLKILLAEDNRVNQALAVRLLEKKGHAVVVVETGRAALELSGTQPFDLILMDVQMPVMDGLDATAAISAREAISGQHVPIIAMTAHAMVGDKQRCIDAGMDGYISKPVQITELFSAIENLPAIAHSHAAAKL